MDGQRLERMIRVAMVTALIMSAGTTLYLCIIQGPPTWDGGDHSFHALRIHQALSPMNGSLLLRFTREQNLWPFLHSWIAGSACRLFGPSFLTIRCMSLLFAFFTVCLTAGYTRHHQMITGQNHRCTSPDISIFRFPAAGAAAFFLAGSPLFIIYSVQPMLEIFGAAFTIAVLWCVAAAAVPAGTVAAAVEPESGVTDSSGTDSSGSDSGIPDADVTDSSVTDSSVPGGAPPEHRSRRTLLNGAAGMLLAATFFLKYVYALLLIAGLGVFFLWMCIRRLLSRSSESHSGKYMQPRLIEAVLWFAPVTIAATLWFSRAPALRGFLVFRDNPDTGFGLLDPVNWMIYPVTILLYYVSSPLLGIFALWLGIRVHRAEPSPFTVLAGIYTVTAIILLTIYRYKLVRAPFTIIPCLVFLAAAGIALTFRQPFHSRRLNAAVRGLIVVVLTVNFLVAAFPALTFETIPIWRHEIDYMLNMDPQLDSVLTDIGRQVQSTRNVCVTGEFNEISTLQLSYYIRRENNEILDPVPSLFAWNRPRKTVDLATELRHRGFERCLIIGVRPGSLYDTADYREKFAWMSRNLLRPDTESGFTQSWAAEWDNGVTAEFWEAR